MRVSVRVSARVSDKGLSACEFLQGLLEEFAIRVKDMRVSRRVAARVSNMS